MKSENVTTTIAHASEITIAKDENAIATDETTTALTSAQKTAEMTTKN